ncbi:LOW QUALITY PROTEIN: retinitis pigmentosa 1-like 1 protein [Salvelinus alpinus]|uniref:LOW QUALITY PROTEIN: retinitis pigmentosa 1-like 1 protein n=1 Tax=Salvelinus alpinus TaxID=8036 RepID=UPI0039FC2416
MQWAPAGLWDPHGPQSEDGSPSPSPHPPSASHLSHVIAAPPAKRITFYKRGDDKFAGVRMAVHKRSFKCFDALLDDLSQKVPLPFGVRTVTTPRGTHSIKHLEQLEDGGCYLCSDRRQAKPINMELAGKRPALWHHPSRRVPQRPAEDPCPPTAPSHTPTRQRRILLVRNSDPAVRRSVILSRRSTRSLRVFLEDISELMQCHVRKLYTLEGRKIDSAQSLMTCPGVLVCVGREPFRPLLLEYVTKSSEEKLPGLGSRPTGNGARSPGTGARSPGNGKGSRSSVCSEGHDIKKNVNFGLETKKSIIHPRLDSSNRSTRFSLSSEKSYANGLSTCPHSNSGREAVLNDDIEKRVLVNKDGSLSVEMRVRFNLHNDETLQWSTEIKKSPSDSLTNDCCPLREAQPCYLQQGQSESCSDPDYAFCVAEAADYVPKPPQRSLKEPQPRCACCYQRPDPEYDLWENPAHIQTSKHSHSRVRHTHSSSSSSSCRSSRVVRRRAMHKEGSEPGRVVQECCVREEVQRRVEVERDGGMVEVCTVSRSCSRSELNLTDNQGEERPLSSSSHVLQALQEDVDALPPSASRCCHSNDPPQPLPLTPRPPSHLSSSSRSRKHTPAPQREERGEGEEERRDMGEDRASRASSRRTCHSCSCRGGEVNPQADQKRADSKASHRSRSFNRITTPVASEEGDDEDDEEERAVSVMSTHTGLSGGSGGSVGSMGSTVCPDCGGCDHRSSSASCPSQRSQRSKCEEERSGSGLSGGSDESGFSQRTNRSNCTHYYQEGRAASRMSHLSLPEEGEDTGKEGEVEVGEKREEGEKEERAASALSAKSFSSVKGRNSRTSHKSKASESLADMEEEMEGEMEEEMEEDMEEEIEGEMEEEMEGEVKDRREQRPASAMSAKCNLSVKSNRSHKSYCSKSERAPSSNLPEAPATDEVGEERPASAMSTKSTLSAKSSRSHKSTCSKTDGSTKVSAREASPRSEPEAAEDTGAAETEDREASVMSDKTSVSAKSSRCHKSTSSQSVKAASVSCDTPEVPGIETTGEGEEAEEGEKTEERAESSMSAKSNLSAKSSRSHKSTYSKAEQAPSPNSEAPETEPGVDGEGEERAASTRSTKTSDSAKSSRSHKFTRKATSPKPAACETPVNDPAENTEEQRAAVSGEIRASVRSSRSHKSTCSRSARAETPVAKDIPAIETTEGDENGSAAAAGDTEERPASTTPAKMNASVKSSRSHKSTKPSERVVSSCFKGANILAIETTVKSSRSHKSTCSKAERAPSPNSPEVPASAVDEEGERAIPNSPEVPASAVDEEGERAIPNSPEVPASAVDEEGERAIPNSPEVPASAVDEEGERAASTVSAKTSASAKSSRSHKSTCSRKVRAETPGTKNILVITTTGREETVDDTIVAGDTEERPASAISAKTSASVKSSRLHKSSCSRRAENPSSKPADVPVIETTGGDEVGEEKERAASAMSAKSNTSAKSSRSIRSTCNGSTKAVSPVAQDIPAIETTGEKEQGDKEEEKSEERPASAMSAKSTTSDKSTRSHKSSSSRRAKMPADVPVVETTGGDEKGEGTERPASAMSTKSNVSAKSSRSHKSTCNSGSSRAVSPAPKTADVPAIETTEVDSEGEKTEERPVSAMSAKSHVSAKSSTSNKSNGSNRSMFLHRIKERGERGVRPVPSTTGDDLETGSVKSAMSTKLKSKADSSPTRPLSRTSQTSAEPTNQTLPATTETTNEESQSQAASKAADRVDDVRHDVTEEKAPSVRSKRPAKAAGDSRPASASSARSTRSKVKVEKASDAQEEESPNTSASDFLQVKGQGHRVKGQSDTGSVRSVKTVIERKSRPKSPRARDSPSLSPSPTIQLETASISDSLLSQFLSAADLLKGNMAAVRPSSPAGSKVSLTESGKSGQSRRSRKPKQEEAELEMLDLLCLPNTLPNDVVSDWLRGIPADGGMDNPEDEMNKGIEETEEGEEAVEKGGETEGQEGDETTEKQELVETTVLEQENTAETRQQEEEVEQGKTAETGQQEEKLKQENTTEAGQQEKEQENTAEPGQQEEEEEVKEAAEHPEEEVKEEEEERGEEGGAAVEQEKEEKEEEREEGGEEGGECSECAGFCPDPAPPTNDITSSRPRHLFLSKESELPRSCHSSVAVMKVLLSPTLGRCSSLPEISPVYGRRLSSSAKGLLDCLAQLQLIDPPSLPAADPSPDRDQRYQEVMDILESLWLSKPNPGKGKEGEAEGKERLKDSGVDLSSGSAGSGGSGKGKQDETAGDITPIAEGEEEGGEGEAGETEEGEGEEGGDGETEGETEGGEGASAELLSDTATPDIASRVQSSPGEDEAISESPAGRGEMLQTPESLRAPSSPSSSNSTAYKSPTDIERDTPEDTTSSGTPPSVQRALLTKRVSQDPDPVWVLNLLKKLEKQFMTHYVDAMAEFKVRWDLDNNVMLDTMITELRDEVKKRIQTSIDRELRKIRGRAGRGGVPRPPILSRDSTVTDQRRRRLKVMKVQSVNKSDGEQGSGADVSDQRSEGEDEYCPCDACIRKKADVQQIKMEAVVATAPVMMAFDLRKILLMKKDPKPLAPSSPTEGEDNDRLKLEEKKEEEEGVNLEVVHKDEEEEETKEDIIPTVVIEEAIPEEEEEGVTEGEEGEEEAQESDGAESVMGEVEEEIAEEIAEEIEAEEQEEDGVVEGTEEEEEGEMGGEISGEDGVEAAQTGEGEELVEGEEEGAGDAEAVQEDQAGGDENTVDGPAEGDEVVEEMGEGEETGEEEGEGEEGVETGEGTAEEDETGGEEEEEDGGEEAEENNVVSEFKVEKEEEEENENTAGETKTKETGSDGHKMASAGEGSGGKGQRRSRSPARAKRRKPKESDVELDDLEM